MRGCRLSAAAGGASAAVVGTVAGAVAIGGIGAVLTLAGFTGPAIGALTLLFLVAAPSAAVSWAVAAEDVASRVALGFLGAVAVNAVVASVMLALGLWSPRGGLAAVAAVSAACAAARAIRDRRKEGVARGADHGRPSS